MYQCTCCKSWSVLVFVSTRSLKLFHAGSSQVATTYPAGHLQSPPNQCDLPQCQVLSVVTPETSLGFLHENESCPTHLPVAPLEERWNHPLLTGHSRWMKSGGPDVHPAGPRAFLGPRHPTPLDCMDASPAVGVVRGGRVRPGACRVPCPRVPRGFRARGSGEFWCRSITELRLTGFVVFSCVFHEGNKFDSFKQINTANVHANFSSQGSARPSGLANHTVHWFPLLLLGCRRIQGRHRSVAHHSLAPRRRRLAR